MSLTIWQAESRWFALRGIVPDAQHYITKPHLSNPSLPGEKCYKCAIVVKFHETYLNLLVKKCWQILKEPFGFIACRKTSKSAWLIADSWCKKWARSNLWNLLSVSCHHLRRAKVIYVNVCHINRWNFKCAFFLPCLQQIFALQKTKFFLKQIYFSWTAWQKQLFTWF